MEETKDVADVLAENGGITDNTLTPEPDNPGTDSVKEVGKEPEAPNGQVETKADPEKESLRQEVERLRQEKENVDKRLKDTQAAFTKKSEELKQLKEKNNQDLDGWWGDGESATDDDNGGEDNPSDEEKEPSDVEKLQEEVKQLKANQEQAAQEAALKRWQDAETPVRAKYSDYTEVVDNNLIDAINKNDARAEFLKEEFKARGGTPEAAYEVGVMLLRMEGKNTESNKTSSVNNSGSPDFNSMPPMSGGENYPPGNPLNELFEERKRKS